MSTRLKNFFFTAVPGTDRFLSGDEPTEAVMRDFTDSIAFKLESSDTATETAQGLVETATQAEFDGGIDSNGLGYSLYVRPSMIKVAIDAAILLLQTQIDSIVNDITNINNTITTIQNDITTIQNDITTINTTITTVETTISNNTPIGLIVMHGSTTAPSSDYLSCDGSSYSAALFPDLFTVIGTTYGGGAGVFNVPDLRQKFIAGYDGAQPDYNTPGAGAGADSVTLTANESGLSVHDHGLTSVTITGSTNVDGTHSHSFKFRKAGGNGNPENYLLDGDESGVCSAHDCVGGGAHSHVFTADPIVGNTDSNAGASAASAHENRPSFVAMPYFIKAT